MEYFERGLTRLSRCATGRGWSETRRGDLWGWILSQGLLLCIGLLWRLLTAWSMSWHHIADTGTKHLGVGWLRFRLTTSPWRELNIQTPRNKHNDCSNRYALRELNDGAGIVASLLALPCGYPLR